MVQLTTLLAASAAWSNEPPDPVGASADALPGIARVGVPGPLPGGATFALSAGYGLTEEVLGSGDVHHRAAGAVAAGLTVAEWLAVVARFDGRYDAHAGAPNGSDDGWVGDPRLVVRATTHERRGPNFGGQLTLWAPGTDAPSLVAEAISADLLVLGALHDGPWVFATHAGIRIDRSAASLPDRDALSRADRLSWGASDSNAVLLGIGARWRAGPGLELLGEGSWDLLVGEDAPSPIASPLRFGVGARWAATSLVELSGLLEASASARPAVGRGEPLVPIEPRVTALVILGLRTDSGPPPIAASTAPAPRAAPPPRPPRPPAPAAMRGRVVTTSGVPIAHARVTIVREDGTEPIDLATGDDGSFDAGQLPALRVTLRFRADEYRDAERVVELQPGRTEVFDQALERALPAGQIRGVISAFRGAPLPATITLDPGGATAVAEADGSFHIDVSPGAYVVEIRAQGYRTQRRRVRIEERGVVVLIVDLMERRR